MQPLIPLRLNIYIYNFTSTQLKRKKYKYYLDYGPFLSKKKPARGQILPFSSAARFYNSKLKIMKWIQDLLFLTIIFGFPIYQLLLEFLHIGAGFFIPVKTKRTLENAFLLFFIFVSRVEKFFTGTYNFYKFHGQSKMFTGTFLGFFTGQKLNFHGLKNCNFRQFHC